MTQEEIKVWGQLIHEKIDRLIVQDTVSTIKSSAGIVVYSIGDISLVERVGGEGSVEVKGVKIPRSSCPELFLQLADKLAKYREKQARSQEQYEMHRALEYLRS